MRISDWSSDVCSSDLHLYYRSFVFGANRHCLSVFHKVFEVPFLLASQVHLIAKRARPALLEIGSPCRMLIRWCRRAAHWALRPGEEKAKEPLYLRSEEHTSELQSLMRISYAVFCLKKKKQNTQ